MSQFVIFIRWLDHELPLYAVPIYNIKIPLSLISNHFNHTYNKDSYQMNHVHSTAILYKHSKRTCIKWFDIFDPVDLTTSRLLLLFKSFLSISNFLIYT